MNLKFNVPKQVLNYRTVKINISAKHQSETYSSHSDCAFPESVEVLEELLDTDTILEHIGLESSLHIQLNVQ